MVASAARERLGTCSSADCLQDFFSCLDYPVWRALAFSDKLAFDYFEITLVVVATTATGNRAHVYVCATEWNHLQVLVPVAGRRCHGGVLPTRHSMVDLLTESRVPFRFVGLQPFCHGVRSS